MSVLKAPLSKNLKIALIQIKAGADKAANLAKVRSFIDTAVANNDKLDLVMLPECFNSPYSVSEFRNYAEPIPNGETTEFLAGIAKKYGIFVVGGSFPEIDADKIYNTSLTFDRQGNIIAKHRKVHLFDIDIPNGITFKESITLSGGDKATVFRLGDYGNVGLGICYDIRFPELAHIASRNPNNGFAMFYPGAFNTVTGPLHWHLLARSRAVDNQVFTVLCSPARDLTSGYHAFGHSLVVDPSGNIIAEAGEDEEILVAELDAELLPKVRTGVPVNYQRRFDVYEDLVGKGGAKVSDL